MAASACSFEALRHCLADGVPPGRSDEDSVRRQWWAALSVLQDEDGYNLNYYPPLIAMLSEICAAA